MGPLAVVSVLDHAVCNDEVKGPPLEFAEVHGAEGSPKGNRKRHSWRKE